MGTWRGFEKIFVEVSFLFESFHSCAQVGNGVADAMEFLGVHLERFTVEPGRSASAFDDLGHAGDENQRDYELRYAHCGTLSAVHGYCNAG